MSNTPADAYASYESAQDQLWNNVIDAAHELNILCGNIIQAIDADDGSRSGRSQLGAAYPKQFRSIYGRYPRQGWRRKVLGP